MSAGGAALLSQLSLSSARVAFTGRAAGDMGHGGDAVPEVRADVAARRRAVVDAPWTWLHQVHGARVVRTTSPGEHAGVRADAAVTAHPGCALAVLSADCAPVALASAEGVVGVAHAGWRGAAAGVIEATVAEMKAQGASRIEAAIGPCIHAGCYEFGAADLDFVAGRLGDTVRATTTAGRAALDLPAAVRAALRRAGLDDGQIVDTDVCTACSAEHFSWRARHEKQRQATVVWR
ncbi:MAG: polyphenol oxidase family protein [Acidimicrobiales bacterium]